MRSEPDAPKRLFGAAAAASALLLGCSNDFDPASRVTGLRVLAVHADLPYAHPGETVALDALSYDPAGRSLTWGWATCENPSDSSTVGCLEALRARRAAGEDVRLTTGAALDHFSVTVPDDALVTAGPIPGRSLLGVVAVACPGVLEPGISAAPTTEDPLPIVCRDASGVRLDSFDFVVGMKRIFVRAKDRNENPEIGTLTWDGVPWRDSLVPSVSACDKETNVVDDCDGALRHHVRVDATPASFESGVTETGASFEEQLVVQYYATEGTFADDVRVASRPETEWVARPSARGKEVRFWLVLRDDRGGVTWAERRVNVLR